MTILFGPQGTFGWFSYTTSRDTIKILYSPQAANPIPTPYSRRCWAAVTLLMTGMR